MAGLYGTYALDIKRSIPDPKYFIDIVNENTINVIENKFFQLVHFRHENGFIKCGLDKSERIFAGYAGYIENLRNVYVEHMNYNEFNHSTALAGLYGTLGDKLWRKLNGNFVAVIYDSGEKATLLVSDRVGSVPLYYTLNSHTISFATSMLGLASAQPKKPVLNIQAVVEYLSFGYALDDHTLIRDIHMIEDATIVKYQDGNCSVKKYWVPDFTNIHGMKDENEVAEGLNAAIDGAINRFCSGTDIGLAMSGGLDSRHIAARVPDKINLAIVNGNPDSHEVKGAQKVCQQLKIPLEISQYDTNDFAGICSDAILATDGLINTPEYLIVSRLLSEKCNAGIFGAYGNGIRGHIGPDLIWEYDDFQKAKTGLCAAANREYIQFSEAKHAFGSLIDQDLIQYAINTFHSSIDKINEKDPYDSSMWQDIYYRNRRRIFPVLGVGRRCLEIRFPFTDNDLVEFAFSMPKDMKVQKDVYRLAFIRRYPELARISNQLGQNYFYETKYGWLRQVKRKIYHASPDAIKFFFKPMLPVHANPANRDVYHTSLKDESIERLSFLSDSGILDKSYIDNVLKEQITGYVNRYPLMHKFFTLSCLINGIKVWQGMEIPH